MQYLFLKLMIEFYVSVARRDTTGFSAEGWHPELIMTREEALKSLIIWGAMAAFEEDLKGSLTTGKLADLVVLDRDLMTAPQPALAPDAPRGAAGQETSCFVRRR